MIHHQFERTLSVGVLALGLTVGGLTTGGAQAQDGATRVYPTGLVNIAAATSGGRVIESTSTLDNNTEFAASNLIDGQVYNVTTKVGSAGWISNKFDPVSMDAVTIGFKDNEIQKIGKLVINPASSAAPERWAKDIEVQVSTEAATGPYTPVAQITLKRSPEPQEFVILPAEARFVRLMVRSNWGSDRAVALGEVEIYAAIDQGDAMGNVIGRLESAIKDLQRFNETQSEIQANMGSRSANADRSGLRQVSTNSKAPRVAQGADRPAGTENTTSGGGNIAAASNGGKIVDVTSVFNDDPLYKADNLINGQVYDVAGDKGDFGWASQGFAPGRQWVTIGFKDDRTRLVDRFVFNPASNQATPRWATRIEVQVTTGTPTDGPFRTVGTFNVRPQAANQDFTVRPVETKYVRFVFTANGPGNPSPLGDPSVSSDRSVSLGEIEIYEPKIVSNDLGPLIGRFTQVLVDLKRMNGTAPVMNTAVFSAPTGAPVSMVSASKTLITPAPKSTPEVKKSAAKAVATKTPAAKSVKRSTNPAKRSTHSR
jgi:hypothetical protein